MRRLLFLFIALFVGAAATAAPPKPNIVLIMADDLGYSDLGCYGSEVATPNLDRLAANGLRFTQFYNCGRCCPTRASLLTGLYPHQAGIGHMLGNWSPPAYSNGLHDRCVTIAQLLKPAGYRTYQVGKWHVSPLAPAHKHNWPLQRGFDRCFALIGERNHFLPKSFVADNEIVPQKGDVYATNIFSDQAVKYLEEGREQKEPFFLYLAYTAPHFPLHALPEDIDKYVGKYRGGWDQLREKRFARMKELGIASKEWTLSPRDPDAKPWESVKDVEEWDRRMAVHAAMIECMDRGIGRVVETLKKQNQLDNTLIFFLSDNGASAEYLEFGHKAGSAIGTKESFRTLETGWANAANTPFRYHKMWMHEGGIATPLIAHWPAGMNDKGGLTREVGHVIDMMATCLDVAGVEYPKAFNGKELVRQQGRSLLPTLQGKPRAGHDGLFWEHEGNKAIRQGQWKLVAEHGKGWELYNLEADRTEQKNLAGEKPDLASALAVRWEQWAKDVGVRPWRELAPRFEAGLLKQHPEYRKK